MLYLRALGGLSIEQDGILLTGPAVQRRRLALVTVLALAGERGISRDRVLALFWPESDGEHARGALKQTLYTIRRDLGAPDLIIGVLDLKLNPGVVNSDVVDFERLLDRGDMEHAVELYAGSLLDGVHIAELPELERWLEREAARLKARYADALRTLALAADDRGDLLDAVAWCRKLAESDPLSASAAVGLMRALARTGDSASALLHAQVYERLVRSELDAAPDPAVSDLVAALRTGHRAAIKPLRPVDRERSSDPFPADPPENRVLAPRLPASLDTESSSGPNATQLHREPAALAIVSPANGESRHFSARRLAFPTAAALVMFSLFGMVWWRWAPNHDAPEDRTIAVLPFQDLSGHQGNNYYGEGIAEQLTTALTSAGLSVIGRGSARSLSAAGWDDQAIGKQLGVASVLRGSVQREDRRLRINVSLISVATGATSWANSYTGGLDGVFAMQDNIARDVAATLNVPATRTASFARRETADAEAHALYLQGLYLWNRRNGPRLRQAIDFFSQAVQRDPNYGRAVAGLAMAHLLLPQHEDLSSDEWTSKAITAARSALLLDSTLAEAHSVLGLAQAMRFENAEALRSFETAVRLDSALATTRHWYSQLLSHVGRSDDAMQQAQRARALEPASLVVYANVAQMALNAGRPEMADSILQRTLALDSTFELAHFVRSRVLIELGKLDEAITVLERLARQPAVRASNKLGVLAYAYARAGRQREARLTLSRIPTDSTVAFSGDVAVALYALGDRDAAVKVFEKAAAQHEHHITIAGRSAAYDGLRREPRLAALVARIESAHNSRRQGVNGCLRTPDGC